jgi:hypothetical protein
MSELSDMIHALKPVSTATIATVLLNRGLRRVWMSHAADSSRTTPRGRTRVYPTFHSCARGSGYDCLVVISALDESGDRGDASRLHRGG